MHRIGERDGSILPQRTRQRHRFSDHIQRRATDVCKRPLGNIRALSGVLNAWGRIVLSIGACYVLSPFIGWWASYAICVICIGCWQRGLATLLHESSHKRLAENKYINFTCGAFASGYLILQSWNAYKESHGDHHLYLGDDENDPDLKFLLNQGAYSEQRIPSFVWKFLISPLLLQRTPAKVTDLIRNRFLSSEEPLSEKLFKMGYAVLICSILVYLGLGFELVLFWFVPLVTSFPVVNWYLELFKHFPHVRENDIDLKMTRNRWTGWIGKFFLGVFHENYHQTHHLFPHCPYWRLPELHNILMDDPEYRATQFREIGLIFPVISGVPSIVGFILNSVRNRCKSRSERKDTVLLLGQRNDVGSVAANFSSSPPLESIDG